jgi:hypothetical protein
MYQADPSGFTWSIRKGLFPGFDVGEKILYDEKGNLKNGVIASIGNVGAFVHSLDNPGLGYAIPGAFIHKAEKNRKNH